jgi:hypothetical protein
MNPNICIGIGITVGIGNVLHTSNFQLDSLGATGEFSGEFSGITFSNEYISIKYDLLSW